MLADINDKFFQHVAEGDDSLKELIQARGQIDDEPGQDGGAVQVAQAQAQAAQPSQPAAAEESKQ